MELALLFVAVVAVVVAVVAVLLARARVGGEGRVAEAVATQLQRGLADLGERIARSAADIRQETADRIAQGDRDLRERVEAQLAGGRREQDGRLAATALALDQKFEALRASLLAQLAEFRTATEGRLGGLEQRIQSDLATGRQELAQGLQLATRELQQRLAELAAATQQSLEAVRSKVDERLGAIGEQVQAKLDQNIREGFAHFERVQEHLQKAQEQLRDLADIGGSVTELNALLKLPHLRGGFGEATLERLLADFLPATSYELQAQVTPGSTDRVDAVVRFPRTRLPIDSKFPREQVLPLFDSSDPDALAGARQTLAQVLKAEARRIAKYIRPDGGTTDMALMFLPSETLYFEVIRDVGLWEDLAKLQVFPVSPNTLAITLKGLAVSYEYYEMAQNVEKTIEEIRKAQRHFGHFQRQFEEVGSRLDKAQQAFHTASTHLTRYSGAVVRLTGEPAAELPGAPPSLPEPDDRTP